MPPADLTGAALGSLATGRRDPLPPRIGRDGNRIILREENVHTVDRNRLFLAVLALVTVLAPAAESAPAGPH